MADNSNFTTLTPSNTSSAGLGDDEFRSIKSQMLAFWQEEHYLLDGSTSSAGEHKPGSARAYVGSSSQLSNPRTGAIFFNTSDRGIYVAESGSTFSKYLANDLYIASDQTNTWTQPQHFEAGLSAGTSAAGEDGIIGYEFFTPTGSEATIFDAGGSGRNFFATFTHNGSGLKRFKLGYRSSSLRTILYEFDNIDNLNSFQNATLEAQSGTSFSSLKVGNGATVAKILSGTAVFPGADVGPGLSKSAVITVTGAQEGDAVFISGGGLAGESDLILESLGVTAADTVGVRIHNLSAVTASFATVTIRAVVMQF